MAPQGRLIDVRGLAVVDRALKEVTPDLRRQMFADIGGLVKARVTAAKAKTPWKKKRYPGQAGLPHLRTATYLTKAGSKRDVSGGTRQGLFGFKAIANAPHAAILNLANTGSRLSRSLTATYGPTPRFLAGEFLPSGQGGTSMWRESRDIVESYIAKLNDRIESQAGAA